MRFGCCANMLVPLQQGTGAELVEQIAALGFDYLELPLARIAALGDDEFTAVRRHVAATGLATESCNDFFPPELQLTGPQADLSRALAYAQPALRRASQLGAKIVVFGSGPARTVAGGFPKTDAFEQLVRLLRELAPAAGKHGLAFAIQ